MQTEEDRKIRFRSQGDTFYENSIIPIRYGAIFQYNPNFYHNKKIVDLGCGFGGGTAYISDNSQDSNIIGIDINEDDLKTALNSYTRPNIAYMKVFAWDTKLDNDSVDLVVNVECIEHNDFEERDLMLKEINRILKKDSYLIITTPNKRTHLQFFSGSHFMEYEYDELQTIVNKFGFEFVWGNPNIGVDSMCLLFKKTNGI